MEAKKLSSKRTLAILLLAIGCVGLVLGVFGLVGEGGMDPYDARNGIAMVYATVYDNQGNSESGSGTGWAVGKPGKPIQYIVTNGHVVEEAYTYPRYDASRFGGEIRVYFSAAEKTMCWQRLSITPRPMKRISPFSSCPPQRINAPL